MPQRATRHNIHWVYNALALSCNHTEDRALLLVDFRKAFDSVDWHYLFSLLERMNFGTRFLGFVRLLHSGLRARVRVGRTLSAPLDVFRGTRQGFPLSPLLFALAIEPLANLVRGTL